MENLIMNVLNKDNIPLTLEDALSLIKNVLTSKDIDEIKNPNFSPDQLHFGTGMYLRNTWKLWESKTPLVKWFKETYNIDHADDISSIILDCLHKDIVGEPRRDTIMAKEFIKHWNNKTRK